MKKSPNHDVPARLQMRVALGSVAMLVAICSAASIGCGKKAEETPPPAAESMTESTAGGTQGINLNWSQQDSCVTFVPRSTSIHVGDRVNFTTNAPMAVTVTIPAGLFSVGDTTITVARGANSDSPTARALGTYPLTSSPKSCPTVTGGGGPEIIVDSGTTTPKP